MKRSAPCASATQRNLEYGWGRFLRVTRSALLAHCSSGHVVFRGLVPEGPPEVESILKPPPNSTRDSSQIFVVGLFLVYFLISAKQHLTNHYRHVYESRTSSQLRKNSEPIGRSPERLDSASHGALLQAVMLAFDCVVTFESASKFDSSTAQWAG